MTKGYTRSEAMIGYTQRSINEHARVKGHVITINQAQIQGTRPRKYTIYKRLPRPSNKISQNIVRKNSSKHEVESEKNRLDLELGGPNS